MTRKKNKKYKSILSKIILSIVWGIIIVGIIISTIVVKKGLDIIKQAPPLSIADFYSGDSSIIYDSQGNVITELGLYLRENVTYDQLPQSLIDAFVSIEDSRFFEHNGFDIPRFFKAFLSNIKTRSFGQGGSTFTMQLVKNTYFQIDNDGKSTIAIKSIDRKVQEIYLAYHLEKISNKEEILMLYLNKVNFGANIRGIEKAAQYYFNKSVKELTLSESAMLAGIVNLPNVYNPYNRLDEATKRRNKVLDLMKYHGYIDDKQCELAKSIKVEDLLSNNSTSLKIANDAYQSYIDAVIEEVKTKTGMNPYDTPMKIYTHLDLPTQELIHQIQNNAVEEAEFTNDLMQVATVVLNNQTGEIVALGGGRYQEGERLFNRATQSFIQPGSSVKPILSYALAFEHLGYATSHVVTDKPIHYRGTNKIIKNFSGRYEGDLTLKDAIGKSLNTPAILTLQDVIGEIGKEEVVKYLNNLGFSKVTTDLFDISYAIGGSSFLVSPLELANAHATMINLGTYNEPHTIKYIKLSNGDILTPEYTSRQVISPAAAYLTDITTEYAVSGPFRNYMQLLKRDYPIYGKTGTTDWAKDGEPYNIPIGQAKDTWMTASSSQYTATVWLGFDRGIKDQQTYLLLSDLNYNLKGRIIKLLLDKIHEGKEKPKAVERPEGLSTINHIQGTFPYAHGDVGTQVSGLVKDEFNKTESVYAATPKTSLDGISGWADDEGNFTVNWAGFPYYNENGQLVKDLSLTVDGKTVTAVGNVMFDYSWALGTPHFVGRLYVNGGVVQDFTSDSASFYGWYDPALGTSNLKVCGYFYYDSGATSGEKCAKIR